MLRHTVFVRKLNHSLGKILEVKISDKQYSAKYPIDSSHSNINSHMVAVELPTNVMFIFGVVDAVSKPRTGRVVPMSFQKED